MSKRKQRQQENESNGKNETRGARRKTPKVPPPDNKVWPEQYRGKNWKRAYAFLFEGRCQLCAYSCPLPKSRQLRDKLHGQTPLLLCTNHPDSPGELCEVLPIDTCRNFKMKFWQPVCRKPPKESARPVADESDAGIRRIPLGYGLFAIVDAADYEKVRRYHWYPSRHGRKVYAACNDKGRTVYMHRMLMRPPKGYVVDHIDGNGLNNRRCNLRVCTPAQNLANQMPRGGTSQFAGVYRSRKKWLAYVTHRAKYYYVGVFDDEVEAAKARDRKAYELHGEYAYLNFPEDFTR